MKSQVWFKDPNCTQVDIIKYKSLSDDNSLGMVTIKDEAFVRSLVEQISSLPATGDEKIKWAPTASRVLLVFTCRSGEFREIEIIGGKFKTPTTGFNSKVGKNEEALAEDLGVLADPQIGTRILKIKDHRVDFKDFSVTFLGDEHKPQPAGGPTVGPTSESLYRISVKGKANNITARIFTGQVPPSPQAFVVDTKIYHLVTYENGKPIYPRYFVIADQQSK